MTLALLHQIPIGRCQRHRERDINDALARRANPRPTRRRAPRRPRIPRAFTLASPAPSLALIRARLALRRNSSDSPNKRRRILRRLVIKLIRPRLHPPLRRDTSRRLVEAIQRAAPRITYRRRAPRGALRPAVALPKRAQLVPDRARSATGLCERIVREAAARARPCIPHGRRAP